MPPLGGKVVGQWGKPGFMPHCHTTAPNGAETAERIEMKTNIFLNDDTAEMLRAYQEKMQSVLGFKLTSAQAVAYLLAAALKGLK
jgi:hypothetical protein